MNIQEAIERRVELQQCLLLSLSWNHAGKTTDELAEMEMQRVEWFRESNKINAIIDAYVSPLQPTKQDGIAE